MAKKQRGPAAASPGANAPGFQPVLDDAPMLVRMNGPDNQCTWTNRSWLSFTGSTLEDEAGEGWVRHVHPADRARCLRTWNEAFSARLPCTMDYRLRRHDGVYRWILDNSAPVADAHGMPQGRMASCVDITTRKEAEERMRLLTEAGKLGAWDWDVVANTITWTDPVYAIHGVRKGSFALTMESYRSLLHPEDCERVHNAIRATLDHDAPYEIEFRVMDDEGRTRWVFTSAVVVRDGGRPIRMLGTTMDITDRKVMEMQLAQTRDDLARQVSALTHLHELALRSAGPVRVEEALKRVLKALVDVHGADRGLISRSVAGTGRLTVMATHALPAEAVPLLSDLPLAPLGGACSIAFGSGERVIVTDIETDERLQECRPAARMLGFRSVHSTPVKDQAGALIGVLTVMFREPGREPTPLELQLADLCARHAAEAIERERHAADLRAGDERFSRFMEHLPGHAWIKDNEGRYVYINEGVAQALGLDRASIIGRTDQAIFPPGQAEHHLQSDRQVRTTGQGIESIDRMAHTDGLHHSLVSKFLIPDAQGGPPLLGGIAIDITEQRQAQEELHESEERFHLLADNMAQLVWMSDPDGRASWFNRRFHEYTGLSPEEVPADGGLSMLHPDHVQHVLASRTIAHERGEAWEETFPLLGADGQYRWFLMRAIPVRDEHGKVVRWFGTNTDITDQKDAQERLMDADRRKDEFLATLAHELRNPLAPLRTGLSLIQMGPEDAALQYDTLHLMDRQLDHLVRLIDDLMDVSRISRGTIDLRHEEVDLRTVVQLAVNTVQPAMQRRAHHLHTELPDVPVQVIGDTVRLTQVVSNLLHNSAKYTNDRGHIQLLLSAVDDNAILTVIDNGVGIPADMLPQVFDMFTQVDRTLARSKGGLGIGLNIVQRLVTMHGGSVTVQSAGTDQGCTFTVRLPLAHRAAAPVALNEGNAPQ